MINPNKKHTIKGIVSKCDRNADGSIRDLNVLIHGLIVESVLGLSHKTVKIGDDVSCILGFRITSDRYVLEKVRKYKKRLKF